MKCLAAMPSLAAASAFATHSGMEVDAWILVTAIPRLGLPELSHRCFKVLMLVVGVTRILFFEV